MKKFLLSLLAVSAVLSASAVLPFASQPAMLRDFEATAVKPEVKISLTKAPSRAETQSIQYSMAEELAGCVPFEGQSRSCTVAQANFYNSEIVGTFAGNSITKVGIYTGGRVTNNQITRNYVTKATVFLSYDLEGEPFYTQEVTLGTEAFGYYESALTTPYEIQADKPFYIGYTFIVPTANDYGLTFDGAYHLNSAGTSFDYDGGWVGMKKPAETAISWDNYTNKYGWACVTTTISGDKLPQNNAVVDQVLTYPAVTAGKPFELDLLVTGKSGNKVENVEVTYTVGDGAATTATYRFPAALDFGKSDYVILSATCPTPGKDTPIQAAVTKVNGVEVAAPVYTSTAVDVVPTTWNVPTTAVFEEGTGNWCGWCPRGIYVIDYLSGKYDETKFIPVAYHGGSATEPMMTASGNVWISNMATGFPCGYINRIEDARLGYPTTALDYYDNIIGFFNETPAIADVTATAEFVGEAQDKIKISTTTEFVFDVDNSKGRYRLAYVLTEDNVGPHEQNNYFSGQGATYGEQGGWASKGSKVNTIYNDVARLLDNFNGVAGSLPAAITANDKMTREYTISLPEGTYFNVNNVNVVVYVQDTDANQIINAYMVKHDKVGNNVSALSNITVDNSNAPVEYFNLQGQRVQNPANGLFIRRQGSDVKKVIL